MKSLAFNPPVVPALSLPVPEPVTYRPDDESVIPGSTGTPVTVRVCQSIEEQIEIFSMADSVEWLELYPWGLARLNRHGNREVAFRLSDILRVASALVEILEAHHSRALLTRDERRDPTVIADYLAAESEEYVRRVQRGE